MKLPRRPFYRIGEKRPEKKKEAAPKPPPLEILLSPPPPVLRDLTVETRERLLREENARVVEAAAEIVDSLEVRFQATESPRSFNLGVRYAKRKIAAELRRRRTL